MTIGRNIDELDQRLIRDLIPDPRASLTALGKQVGVSGTTIGTRLDRLRDDDLLRIEARPNLAAFGVTQAIWGTVETDTPGAPAIRTTLLNSPYVMRIDELVGEFSLSFLAVFPSDEALGSFLRQIQGSRGVRRLVVHHVLDTVKDTSGWDAVFTDGAAGAPNTYEIAPGVQVPPHLASQVATAAAWLASVVAGDLARVEELSASDVVYRIVRPRTQARTFVGIEQVLEASRLARATYPNFRYRVVNVLEAEGPYDVVIDALSPTEDARGTQFTAFSRFAYAFEAGKVKLAASIGQIDLEDLPGAAAPESGGAPRSEGRP